MKIVIKKRRKVYQGVFWNSKKIRETLNGINCAIYAIVCIKNNKQYIGRTRNLFQRCSKSHLPRLRGNKHNNCYMQKDWNLYGEENFNIVILKSLDENCTKQDLIDGEQEMFNKYKSYDRNYGYNIYDKADGSVIPDEVKKKISESEKGKIISEKQLKQMSEFMKGKQIALGYKHTEETKEKQRNASLGNQYAKGYKHTEATKQRLKESLTGRRETPEQIIKQRKYSHFQDKWIELRNSGLTYREIGDMYNVNNCIVYMYVHKYKKIELGII